MPALEFIQPKVYAAVLAITLAIGIFLRLPPRLFHASDAPLRVFAALHPKPQDKTGGYDERLYESYVNIISNQGGIIAYPDLVDGYIEKQKTMSGSILPPLRFLYIFFGYAWHSLFGAPARVALGYVSSLFSMLTLLLSTLFAARVGRPGYALGIAALMAVAPTQLHMSQHALIDGFFAFWVLLALWALWENLQARDRWPWLILYSCALTAMVLTKENSFFAWIGIVALLVSNRWIKFGVVNRNLIIATFLGPVLGVIILVWLAGGIGTLIATYQLSVSKNYQLEYAIINGGGPWHRYLVDLLLVSPLVLILALGALFSLTPEKKLEWFCVVFIAASYLIMCNIKYGMNLRYANMWDLPLRFLAFSQLVRISSFITRWRLISLITMTGLVCAVEFRQYIVLAVNAPLYELVTSALMHALKMLKFPTGISP
jgi:4-amino-4-deoxy-L-arabinose transferase-like glycosyltransferase